MLSFMSADRDYVTEGRDVTEQVPVNVSTNARETPTVGKQSCIGDWVTCHALNQSAFGHFNSSDSEAYGPPGLEYVTAVATNYTLAQTVVLGLLAGSTSLVTISGNLVVILSFILERSIRQPSNYFIASLAVSDLLIGSISMPFYTVYLLSGKKWPLGPTLCDLWLSLDYTVCLCSIYTVFCITIDRFCSVQIPAKYRNWRTERKVVTVICVTWVVPVLVFFTSIIGWQYFVGKRTVPDDMCYVQYMEDAIFNFLLQFGYFWITLTVMCSLYVGIYRVALRLQRQAEAKHQRRTAMLRTTTTTEGVTMKTGVEASHHPQQEMTIAVAVDQHNSTQQPNGGNMVSGGGSGLQNVEADNKIAEAQLPASSSPKSNKKNRHRKHQGKHSKKQSNHSHDSDDQSSSFAFSSDSDHNDVDHRRGSKAAAERTSVSVAKKRSTAASDKASKKTRRRVTRHTSPVVAVECAVQFIAEQRRTTDDINRPDTELHNICDSSTSQSCAHASADKYRTSFDAVDAVYGGDISFAVETPVSHCQLDHQCVFEACRRPRPRLSPVWVRRQLGGPCRQRGECDDPGGSASSSHVVVVDDHDGPATCGCNSFPSTLANVNCVSVHSPNVAAGSTADARLPTSVATESTTAGLSGQRKWRSSQRRSPGTRDRRRKPFAIIAALRRLSQTRRQRSVENATAGGSTTTAPQPGKTENRARKALRTITIILGAFVLCWTPWHVLSMIMGFCLPCVEPVIYDISYWLCYLNSPINPFCYAFANQQFKKTFLRIIRGDWHRT